MAIGHFMMAFQAVFPRPEHAYPRQRRFQAEHLDAGGQSLCTRRPAPDRAFSIFYIGINLGAFFSPLVCGTLGEKLGWHYGFAAAGIGMLIGLAIYVAGQRTLPPERWTRRAGQPKRPLDRDEWRAILALCVLFLPVTLLLGRLRAAGQHDRPMG